MKAQLATFESTIGVVLLVAVAAYIFSNSPINGLILSLNGIRQELIAYDAFMFLRHNFTASLCLSKFNQSCLNNLLSPFDKIYARHLHVFLNGTSANATCALIHSELVCISGV